MSELLLEIGSEEIPASWLAGLQRQLADQIREIATRERLSPTDVTSASTPRRLVVACTVAARQPDEDVQVWGPSVKVAKDAAGAWTPAALGFAKKQGVGPEALAEGVKDPGKPGERNLLFVKKTEGRDARDVVPTVVAAALRALAFPKRMSWDAWLDDGKGAFPFGRPIRWMVLLLDGAVVPFAIHELVAGARGEVIVRSGNETRGHRFLPRGKAGHPIAVRSFDDLKARLREAFVILDPEERTLRIREGLGAGVVHEQAEEWRDLVEYPTVVRGTIPAEFKDLPREVLETVLVHHQKYVPLDKDGRVATFAAVINTDGAASAEIVRGMERVVVARLRDASFFYGEDGKRALADRVEDLTGVTFHRGLGTYRDKAARLERLVDAMADAGLVAAGDREAAKTAARLAKADLTTLMVREFTELQGMLGGIYLRREKQPEPVASAVYWHYHPVSVDAESAPAGALKDPASQAAFAAVSVADKMDTLAGYFGLGLAPTGSSDPYGLRRAAQGVIRVLLDFWPRAGKAPSLHALARNAHEGYGGTLKASADEVSKQLDEFLLDRLRYVLGARGGAADEIEAVLGAREPDALDDVREAALRLQALHAVRKEAREDFQHLAVAFKRARNIIGQGEAAAIDPARFQDEAERALHRAVSGLQRVDGGYEARLRSLAGLRGPVDKFFDDVLVMAEDPALRANRLGLLSEALSLFYRIADISKLAS